MAISSGPSHTAIVQSPRGVLSALPLLEHGANDQKRRQIMFDATNATPQNRKVYVTLTPGAKDDEYQAKRCLITKGEVTFVADTTMTGRSRASLRTVSRSSAAFGGRVDGWMRGIMNTNTVHIPLFGARKIAKQAFGQIT